MPIISSTQCDKLSKIFPDKFISAGTSIDMAIELLRAELNIICYNTAPPYVSPISDKIEYSFSMKRCNPKLGWDNREFIGVTQWTSDIWKAKSAALDMALNWILDQERSRAKLSK